VKLSVIMPVYNERGTIEEILRRVCAAALDKEIIVVDDGSSDGTRQYLAGLDEEGIKVVFHARNRGKGGAVRTGLAHATGEVVIIQDADLEYDPGDYPALLEPIRQGQAQVVYGSRLLGPGRAHSSAAFYWGGRLITLATNILFNSRLTDEPTCYKVFKREVLESIAFISDGFEWEPEVTAKLLRRGVRITEVPISYHPRKKDQGKKIKPLDGLKALTTLLRYRFLA
jgi:dolichol-phosphate mannosyltransferase